MAYQPQSQQLWDEAIGRIIQQISQQQNIQNVDEAIESLILTGGNYASPSVHALYLQKVPESEGFTRKDISKYLADLGEDHEAVKTYFQLVHFGRLSILDSLRLYFAELRLEALMNKNELNVLLTALATAFKTNGGNFNGDIEDCVRIYNAMIMLNDSLHCKNALGRSRQTEQGFIQIINDRKQNIVNEFDEDEMRRIYQSIQKSALNETKYTNVAHKSNENTDLNGAQASDADLNVKPESSQNIIETKEGDNDSSLSSSSAMSSSSLMGIEDVHVSDNEQSLMVYLMRKYDDKRRQSREHMNKIAIESLQQQIDGLMNAIKGKNREIEEMKQTKEEITRTKIELVNNTNRSLDQMREFLCKYQKMCLV